MSLIATNYTFEDQTDIYRGEVRDVYIADGKFISVATDRLSVFGHIFPGDVPFKGQVINQLTAYFADATEDIVSNWIEQTPDPNVSIGKYCTPFKINFVIRGCLVGHAWRVYQQGGREISGVELPDGLKEYDLFDEPLITPSTKTPSGYEEDISAGAIIEQGLMSESEYERLSIIARQLFIRGKQMARKRGLILADTKYEFGVYEGEIYLIDEIHAPDSSRYLYADEHSAYVKDRTRKSPEDLSKEYIRQWVLARDYSGLDTQMPPVMSVQFMNELSERYIKLYELLTDKPFIKPDSEIEASERIEHRISESFGQKV